MSAAERLWSGVDLPRAEQAADIPRIGIPYAELPRGGPGTAGKHRRPHGKQWPVLAASRIWRWKRT